MATCRPARFDASRAWWNRPAWSAWVPWEKFSRKMSTPAATRASSVAGSLVAGPSVAMIFVCRTSTSLRRFSPRDAASGDSLYDGDAETTDITMTTLQRLDEWRRTELITPAQHEALGALVRGDRFSLFLELNALLYLGVLAIAGGVGWTVQAYFADLGDVVVLLALTSLVSACAYYCFSRALPYSTDAVGSPTLAFDYLLYLGCVVFAIELGYLDTRFALVHAVRQPLVLASAAAFFLAAYRFDNRLVLSVALTTLGAWFGLTITAWGVDSTGALRVSALAYGALVAALGVAFNMARIKRHFLEAYLHLAALTLLVTLLLGIDDQPFGPVYLLALVALGAASATYGIRQRRFAFVGYGAVFPYLGISYKLAEQLDDALAVTLYGVVSGTAMVVLLVYVARRFGRAS